MRALLAFSSVSSAAIFRSASVGGGPKSWPSICAVNMGMPEQIKRNLPLPCCALGIWWIYVAGGAVSNPGPAIGMTANRETDPEKLHTSNGMACDFNCSITLQKR